MEVQGYARRPAIAADGPAQVLSVGGPQGRTERRHLDDDDGRFPKIDDLHPHRERRPRPASDQRLQAEWIGAVVMARPGPGWPSIVLDADQQPARLIARPVGEAHDGLYQLAIGQWARLLALELDVQGLTPGDQLPQPLRRHGLPPYSGASSSLTLIGRVMVCSHSHLRRTLLTTCEGSRLGPQTVSYRIGSAACHSLGVASLVPDCSRWIRASSRQPPQTVDGSPEAHRSLGANVGLPARRDELHETGGVRGSNAAPTAVGRHHVLPDVAAA